MAWLEAHQELRDHPKIKRAARILGISRPQMIGHMLCLWWWCLDYAQDGDLTDFDRADIADAADWQGDPDVFVDALLRCGPTDRPGLLTNGDGLRVHDWDEYGGKYITKRNQGRDRQRTYRERNTPVTRDKSVSNGATEQNRTEQNRTEQEITKEKITEQETPALTPESLSEQTPVNGSASPAVGLSSVTVAGLSFLNRIGFQNPDRFISQVDHILLAQWGYYYSCLTEAERRAVHNWPALVNDRVRNNKSPRWKNDAQKTRFYQELAS